MFTLKFYKFTPEGDEIMHAVSAGHYEKHTRNNGRAITVTTYPGTYETDGVERHISHDEDSPEGHYTSCYVENSSGKTIDNLTIRSVGLRKIGSGSGD